MTTKKTGNDQTPRQFVKDILPDHYEVRENMQGIISCKSREGIESDAEWEKFMASVKEYFGAAFKEVYHSTCTYHLNFTVYYSYNKLYNLENAEDGGYKLANSDYNAYKKEVEGENT